MAGYIGSKASVTQVDGYNRTEADDRYVNASGDTMTGELVAPKIGVGVSGSTYQIHNRVFGNSEIATQYGTGTIATLGAYAEGAGIGADGTVGVKIDSAGRVTMPYQPYMFVRATSYTTANNADLQFAITQQSRGLSWNTSTNSFTVPVSGIYTFSIATRLETTTLNYIYHRIKVNGSQYPSSEALLLQKPNTSDSFQTANTSVQVLLTANDSVSVSVNYNGTGSYNVHSQTWMSVALLG